MITRTTTHPPIPKIKPCGQNGPTLATAEDLAHHADQLKGACIPDTIINTIGLLARQQYALVPQNRQMLRDIALRRTDRIDNLLHTGLLVANHAQYLEAQGMRNRLERTRCLFDMLLFVDETSLYRHDDRDSLSTGIHYRIINDPGGVPKAPAESRMNSTLKTQKPTARKKNPPAASKNPTGSNRITWHGSLLFGLSFLVALSSPPLLSKEKNSTQPTKAEVTEKKGDLKELREQIEALRKETAVTEGKRASIADQLKDAEQEISATQRDLHTLTSRRNALQDTLKDLADQSRELESRLNSQHAQLERLVYRQYLQGEPDSLRLLLNGDDPSQMARDLHYLAAIGRARSQLLQEIEKTLERKQTLAADTRERVDELAAIEEKQKEQHGKLVAQREQRKLVLEKISVKISEQRREIGNLQRDEKQLSQLIERLAKIIATKPVAVPVPRKEAKPIPERRPETKEAAPEIRNESTPEATPSGNFVQGGLRLPVRGVVTNRFGSARQEGSAWKGLFIRANSGSEVRAVAGGRVVFADWMRGFGNLMIVDHGNSYLSIYGNNEALLKQVGDNVRGGDTVASVGNSGGNPESGLYFELRHRGQPLDPLKWVNLK